MSDDLSQPVNELIAAFDEQERTLQETIMKAIARLDQIRAARMALLALESDEPTTFDGKLADAIRIVLKSKDRSCVPVEVRDRAKALGYDFSSHKNQMAAVHGVLKRMTESGEVKTKEWAKQPGVTRYYWSGWDKPDNTIAVTGDAPTAGVRPSATLKGIYDDHKRDQQIAELKTDSLKDLRDRLTAITTPKKK